MIFQNELIKSLKANSEAIAVESGKRRLSYRDLLHASDKVTAWLLEKGIPKGTPVGVLVSDRINLICSLIGILGAGCAFVPIDGSLPANRLALMIKDLDLRHLISDQRPEWMTGPDGAGLIGSGPVGSGPDGAGPDVSGPVGSGPLGAGPDGSGLVGFGRNLQRHDIEEILEREIAPDDTRYPDYDENDSIYIYYTSGSTGIPKGIVGRNASLLQFIQWEIATFGITGGTRVSQFISPYFDAFLRDIFAPLLAGGTICIPHEDEDFFTPEKLAEWIDQARIQLIHCVPSLFRVINNGPLTAGHFQSLRHILLSGEKINPSGLASWYKLFGSRIQLVNLYGATESTLIRAWYPIRPEDVTSTRIPVGMPIADTELLVLDDNLQPCEPLVSGEIYIVSDYLTRGYLNNPELTRERFINIPMAGGAVKKAFKTGDKGRILPDGLIDLIGREDRQAKLRGIRVELDEIENVLGRHAGVKSAVVLKRMEDTGDESLIAYIIRADISAQKEKAEGISNETQRNKEEGSSDEQFHISLKEYLQAWLPAYMIPSDIIEVPEYPLLSNGKIDYKTLAERQAGSPIIAPEGPVETKLLGIWKEILGDKAISTEDSFHKIGGNSLSIMKLIGRIYKEYKVRITLSDLFSNLTIRKQAAFIKRAGRDSLYMIPMAPAKPAYHVSAAQERMYYNQQLNKSSTSYNLPMAWEIRGEIAENRIEEVFRAIIARHESLRTEFHFTNDELQQVIRDQVDFHIEEIRDKTDIDAAIREFIRPFDLDKAPLVRCGIIHTRDGRKILVADFHHIICDGISQVNLLSDLAAIYSGGTPSKIGVQYKDFAEWEFNFRTSEEYLSHREFWLRNFEGEIPKIELPVTQTNSSLHSGLGGSLTIEIPKSTLAPLLDSWNKKEMPPSSGFFSLFFLFLSQISGQEDIVIGFASSGRMQQELENVIGMFVKTLPIRYRLDPNKSFTELARDINNYLIQAYSKQVYDLTNIVMELNAGRAEPIGNLFDTVFAYQSFEASYRDSGAIGFSRRPIDTDSAKYPIMLFTFEGEHSFGFKWEYAMEYFTPADMELLCTQFRSIVESIAADPDGKIIDIFGTPQQTTGLIEDDISFNF